MSLDESRIWRPPKLRFGRIIQSGTENEFLRRYRKFLRCVCFEGNTAWCRLSFFVSWALLLSKFVLAFQGFLNVLFTGIRTNKVAPTRPYYKWSEMVWKHPEISMNISNPSKDYRGSPGPTSFPTTSQLHRTAAECFAVWVSNPMNFENSAKQLFTNST